jgi:geranylgeranylglycerol-phosphate geranylgeranyltransferase
MAGIGVWLGGYLTDGAGINYKLTLGALAAALVCAAGNAFNDYVDIDSDRINHPGRPLPKGELSVQTAVSLAIMLNLFAIIIGIFISIIVTLIILAAIIWLFFYNISFKNFPLIGNLSVAILGGALFLMGGTIVASSKVFNLPGPLVPAIFAFLFHLARELVKDLADRKGDIAAGSRTLAIIRSENAILGYVTALFIILIMFTSIPIFNGWYRIWYGLIAIFLVDLPLLGVIVYLIISKVVDKYRLTGAILKLLMIVGLVAFWAGKV